MERLRGTCISIHASAREATRGATFQADHKIISIHASAREVTFLNVIGSVSFDISIHASAREATHPNAFLQLFSHDFNPRLREGSDQTEVNRPFHLHNFNPRLREGGDKKEWKVRFMGNISIHASAREATQFAHLTKDLDLFQSTSPRGRRHPV